MIKNKMLHIRSKNRMLGYLNSDQPFDQDGWYNTRDIVEQDGDFIKVTGRDTDVVNVGGLKFMKSEVEEVALAYDDVAQVKVITKNNPITGQHIEMIIQTNVDRNIKKSEMSKYLKNKLPSHMQPLKIVFDEVAISSRLKKNESIMKSVEINGTCYSKFEKIKDILQKEINTGLSLGSAFAVYHNGEPLIDVYGGYTDKKKIKKWNKKTIVPVHSVGKGIVSLCLMLLMNRKQLDIDAYVADYWSGFSNNSKSQIKIRTLFSHQAGLYGWRKEMKHNDLYDWDYCVNSLAKQKPFHRPEEETCYHAKTIGYLSGEIIRRITKKSVGKFISDELSNKKDLYCYIGVPCEFHSRISEVISMKENSKYNLNRKISDKYSNYGFNNPQSLKIVMI
jgi:hypothetical protein